MRHSHTVQRRRTIQRSLRRLKHRIKRLATSYVSPLGWAVAALAVAVADLQATAQRRISPVRPAAGVNLAKEMTDSLRDAGLVETIDAQGRTVLVDTITGTERPDTLGVNDGSIPKMIQPLIFSATAGLDIWDPVMRLFGQKYGLGEVSLEFNMHNRYIPVVEIGVGQTNYTPARQNYTYKVNPTPYFRIGANYNFLYNSNPIWHTRA